MGLNSGTLFKRERSKVGCVSINSLRPVKVGVFCALSTIKPICHGYYLLDTGCWIALCLFELYHYCHFLQEASTAKYIVQQYTAATGGQPALNSVQSMCVTGQVKIKASDFHQGGDDSIEVKKSAEEVGGFVLWQKNPDLWCLELVVSGCKVSCGSNGKLSWRHSSSQLTPISKGPPRPLRRFLQVSLYISRYNYICLSMILFYVKFEITMITSLQ